VIGKVVRQVLLFNPTLTVARRARFYAGTNSTGARSVRRSFQRSRHPICAQGIVAQSGTRCWIPVARRAALMSSVCRGLPYGKPPIPPPSSMGRGATAILSAKVAGGSCARDWRPIRHACCVQAARGFAGVCPVASPSMNPAMQGSALWRTSDPSATKIRVIGAAKPRRTASMSLILQGSALWRALVQASTKIRASGCAKPRRSSQQSWSPFGALRFVRKGLKGFSRGTKQRGVERPERGSAEPRKARFFAESPAGLSFPRRGTRGGLLTAAKFASMAGGGAKNVPQLITNFSSIRRMRFFSCLRG
jgi:hypothetical protein